MAQAKVEIRTEIPPVVLHTRPAFEMDEEQFFEFCRINEGWRIERTAGGDLEVMVPTGGETGSRNASLTYQVMGWTLQNGTGVAFDSSTGFVLPNGAARSPDASWARHEQLKDLSTEQKQRFLPLCPDFMIELRSPSDPLAPIEAKMREYLENGASLGWLIDPITRRVHVYRSGGTVEVLENPESISGDPVLPGFVLDLRPVWEPGL